MVSTPRDSSRTRSLRLEKRETAITLPRLEPASSARLAIRARVGPIFPPAPRTRMSPESPPQAADDLVGRFTQQVL